MLQDMHSSRTLFRNHASLVKQITAAIVQNRPFDPCIASSSSIIQPWTVESVSEVLRSIPRLFFQSARSIGCQNGFRHRAQLRQRNLKQESDNIRNNVLVLGPAAHRDPEKVKLGLDWATEFFYWVETCNQFNHDEMTCREMACVLARGNRLKDLWKFLKEMSRRGNGRLVTTETVTCLIKVLGEEGLVNEALDAFYRMKQFGCRPDVYAYNTVINALCRVGNFKKARFLLGQMELPGFRCPPDIYTYTILISSYCKYSLQTGCKKAIRRRLWEANHLFRIMLFNGFVPDVVAYNCLIDGCCKTYRIDRALELFGDMNKRGCVPNRVTYNSIIRYYSTVNEIEKAVEMMRMMQTNNHGTPTSSSYTPIIHALCESGRVQEARDVLVESVDGGVIPREYTYKLVCDALKAAGHPDLLDNELRRKIEDDIENRCRQVMKQKQVFERHTSV